MMAGAGSPAAVMALAAPAQRCRMLASLRDDAAIRIFSLAQLDKMLRANRSRRFVVDGYGVRQRSVGHPVGYDERRA